MDLWIFYMYSSNGSLSLETLITQADVDLWIFEIQYIKTLTSKKPVAEHRGFVMFSMLIFHV